MWVASPNACSGASKLSLLISVGGDTNAIKLVK